MEWSILTSSDIYTDVADYGNMVDHDSWENHPDNIDVQQIRETRNRLLMNRLVNSERHMIGSGIPKNSSTLLSKLVNDVRIAAFNYALMSISDRPIPTIQDTMDDNDHWVIRLIDSLSSTRWQEWIPPDTTSPIDAINIAAQAMTLGNDTTASSLWEMTGGAMRLRSGRLIGTPYNLRGPRRYPIYTRGRERDARSRRRIARSYVNYRLRRNQNDQNNTSSDEESEDSNYQRNDANNFHMEIMRLLEEIAREASRVNQDADSNRFTSFPNQFYQSLRSHIAESISFDHEPNPTFIKAWLINYLVAEHLSQILSIFSSKFTSRSRYPRATFCQVILVAKNSNDQDVFKRIWTTTERPYDMFYTMFTRIINDLVNVLNIILNEPDVHQPTEETEAMMMESGLSDVSGDIINILEQVTSYEQIVSIVIGIKLKCRGLVAYSRNESIVKAFKRWITQQSRGYSEQRARPYRRSRETSR